MLFDCYIQQLNSYTIAFNHLSQNYTTMSNVIAIISQKGGAGKSTVTSLLANIFYFILGFRIAVIDADYPQSSISKKRKKELEVIATDERLTNIYNQLYAHREPYPILTTNLTSCTNKIVQIKNDFDFVFIDVTGTMNHPCFTDILMQVNHFLIPVMQDDYSIISGIEFYQLIEQSIRPVSNELVDAHLFFNRVPGMHKLDQLLNDLRKHFNFFPFYLSSHVCYERAFRSTIFPIPRAKKETVKLLEFIQRTQAIWEKNQAIAGQAVTA